MKSPEVNFAAIKQAVTLEAVSRHYQVDDLQGGRTVGIAGGVPSTRARGAMPFTST